MKYSKSIKPISYLKSNAAKIIDELNKNSDTLIITQNGEAKLAVQDIKSYEKLQDTIALLKIIALGKEQVKKGKTISLEDAFNSLEQIK